MDCNSIDWFVDILGTMDLLEKVIKVGCVKDVSARGSEKSNFKGGKNLKDGLYFCDGHWYSVKNGLKQDSYSLGYQQKGTAHFCQTFAAMIYLGEPLVAKEYAKNIGRAMDFWVKKLKTKTIRDFMLREIKTSDWARQGKEMDGVKSNKRKRDQDTSPLAVPNIKLNAITSAYLELYITRVKGSANTFVGCTEG